MSTLELIKKLREQSGAGMSECKKAIEEANGDFDKAVDLLRISGKAKAAKNAGKVAAEGLIGISVKGLKGTMLEVNCQTDFVTTSEKFIAIALDALNMATTVKTIDELKASSLAQKIEEATLSIGEKIDLRRMETISVKSGLVGSYLHAVVNPKLGQVGVIVGLESEAKPELLEGVAKKISMQIAATNAKFVAIENVPETEKEREQAVIKAQMEGDAANAKKPANILEKMVVGKMQVFYKECVLLEQAFIMDTAITIKDVISAAEKEIGSKITITGFYKMRVGEGIEKPTDDFAAEVAKMSK